MEAGKGKAQQSQAVPSTCILGGPNDEPDSISEQTWTRAASTLWLGPLEAALKPSVRGGR